MARPRGIVGPGAAVGCALRAVGAPHGIAALAAIAVLAAPGVARAEDTTAARAVAARELDRPHTAADLSTGFLLLPGALVCPTSLNPATCKRGEFSFAAQLQNIWRWHAFAFGAGIQWAHTLRSDAANGDPNLQREHSRSYFLVEGLGRYYFLRNKSWDFWTGVTAGLVVLDDTWSTVANRNPYEMTDNPGPKASTLGTVGFALGIGIGAEWAFLPNWSFGPSLRYSNWFLPDTRAVTPTLDVASLAGRLDVIDVGIRVSYRIAL
jgi:hypothetical protein